MIKQFIRVTVRVPVEFMVGPFDVPVPDGVDPAEWDEEDIIEAANDIIDNACSSCMPLSSCRVDAYPRDHPFDGEWVPVNSERFGDPEIYDSEQVQHDLPEDS